MEHEPPNETKRSNWMSHRPPAGNPFTLFALLAIITGLFPPAYPALAAYSSSLSSPTPPAGSATFLWTVGGTKPARGTESSYVELSGCWTASMVASVTGRDKNNQSLPVVNHTGGPKVNKIEVNYLTDASLPITLNVVFVSTYGSRSTGTKLFVGARKSGGTTLDVGGPTCAAPNTPPIVNNSAQTTAEDTAIPVTLTATDPDNSSLTFAVGTAGHGTLGSISTPQESTNFAAGDVLVKFKPEVSRASRAAAHRRNGATVKKDIPGIAVEVISVPPGQEKRLAAAYAQLPEVLFAEVNWVYQLTWTPDDIKSKQQWQYHNSGQTGGVADADMDVFEAWNVTQGAMQVPIAILDTGIDFDHEDLNGKVVKAVNFSSSPTVDDINRHGTHVAGSVAATTNNRVGVAGTCPHCVLYNVKVLSDQGFGPLDRVAQGIIWAADNGAKVTNMSLGCLGCVSSTLESAVNYAWSKGVVLVAAAGNDGTDQAHFPASYSNVIAVAATTDTDAKAYFSNYGSSVDVAAPGQNILSTTPNNTYATMSGTSMASPHVAGVAGLVWSTGLCGADNSCIRRQIETKADSIARTGTYWAHGRVNAYTSVAGYIGATPNVLANGGFETDANNDGKPDNWSTNARATRSNAKIYGYVMRHAATDNSSYTIYHSGVGPLSPGATYSFTGWVNIPATSDSFTFKIEVRWKTKSGSVIRTSTIKTYTATTSGWNKATATFVAPAGTDNATLRMVVSSLNAQVYTDDFRFYAGTAGSN